MNSRIIYRWYYSPLTLRLFEIPFRFYSVYLRQVFYDIKSLVTPFKKKEIKLRIDSFNLVPTTLCNAKCVFCAHKLLKDKKGVMNFFTAKKAIDEFSLLGGKEISLTPMVGEALIDKGLFRKIAYAKKKRLENFLIYKWNHP